MTQRNAPDAPNEAVTPAEYPVNGGQNNHPLHGELAAPPGGVEPQSAATAIVDEAQECLAQSLLMFLYADLRLLSATGRINTKFETLCIDSDRVPRTTAANMAQLEGTCPPQDIESMNNRCEGVSPGQVMAILFVELRQEVLAQRKRAKEQMKKDRGWVAGLSASGHDDEAEPSDDDTDAGVMNKITGDRKGRKEFETDMHALLRSYNGMLAQDLKGIPEVKVEKRFANINPLKRATDFRKTKDPSQRPWFRPGQQLSRFFSTDELEHGEHHERVGGEDFDDEGSRASNTSAAERWRIAAMGNVFANSIRRKSTMTSRGPSDLTDGSDASPGAGSDDGNLRSTGTRTLKGSVLRPQLSHIEEGMSEDGTDRGSFNALETTTAQAAELKKEDEPNSHGGKSLGQSKKLFEIIESVKGAKASQQREFDLTSLKSDPGPNNQSFFGDSTEATVSSRAPMQRRTSALKKQISQYVQQYREDHELHNKWIIPKEDYETFGLAEDVANKMVQLRTSMLGMSPVFESSTNLPSDPGRNMSEKELLDFMTECIESRNVGSLDFMSEFFRDNTISQTMVKSKAQVVWLQDWFPIKDCIYAISVDKSKKRVLVVFRGAITRADWSHGFDAAMKRGHNPVKDDYEGKKSYLKIHRGFYTYLFRTRKDTSTRKYDEIANKVYEYGNKMIGSDFTVTVNGYSLGGALSVLFGFYASTDERFTRNGPVKIFSYGMPYAASHSFADAFRHQEKNRKVQHARFYNSNDIVAHLPFNVRPTQRGSNFVHVGIDVKLYSVPGAASLFGSRYPRFRYNDRQPPSKAYWTAIKFNSLLNMPFPWQIKEKHGLPELQKRIARAILVAEVAKTRKNPYLRVTLDEAYEAMVYKNGE